MNTVTLTIDGISVTVPSDYTILEAAKEASINIPTLCYLKDLNKIGACRLCLVEVAGARGLLASCITQVADGMVVKTNTAALRKARKLNLELLLSNHNRECTTCVRSQNCELQALCRELGVDEYAFDGSKNEHTVDELSPSIVRDNSKVHQLPPLHRRLQQYAEDRRHRGHPPRLFHLHRLRVRPLARRFALHQLRPVHHRLPGRRAARKEQHQRRLERAQ